MHLLLVNLYEFGLFLRILLWIAVPLIVVALLVTTWLHYRGRRKASDELILSMEGMDITADPADLLAAIRGRVLATGTEEAGAVEGAAGEGAASREAAAGEEYFSERERNRMYKGILWMKEKYEQYRDLADQRIEQLKDELARSEQRYQDLLDQRVEGRTAGRGVPDLAEALQQRYAEVQRQLEEKDRQIEELRSQLQKQRQLTEDLTSRLQNSSQLLLKISRELDGSLPPASQPQPDPEAQAEAQPS